MASATTIFRSDTNYAQVCAYLNPFKQTHPVDLEKYRDDILARYAAAWGTSRRKWTYVARWFHTHGIKYTNKQCQDRFANHADPKISKKAIGGAEHKRIIELHKLHGNRHALIRDVLFKEGYGYYPENTIKNHIAKQFTVSQIKPRAPSTRGYYNRLVLAGPFLFVPVIQRQPTPPPSEDDENVPSMVPEGPDSPYCAESDLLRLADSL